jgi:hypothetical protein
MLPELQLDLDGTRIADGLELVAEQRLDWVGGRNEAELSWYQNCAWIGLVPELQLDLADTRNAGGMD